MKFHFTPASKNAKTGPIPVTTSSRDTCPTCRLKGAGCYAENPPLAFHWNKVTRGERGDEWPDFLKKIKALPKGQLWRHNQAGDLVGKGDVIDHNSLRELALANIGRRGFLYTHYPMTEENQRMVMGANLTGLTINLSADTLHQADDLYDLDIAPVVVIVHEGWRPGTTPKGRKVTLCPAQQMEDMTCAVCQLCANQDRNAIVAFEVHGARKKAATKIFNLKLELV